MTLGEMIVKWHGTRHKYQTAMAAAINAAPASVSHWVTGRHKPTKAAIDALAKVMGVTPEEVQAALPTPMHAEKTRVTVLPTIRAVAKIVLQLPAGSDPAVKCAMEQILDLCETGVKQKEMV